MELNSEVRLKRKGVRDGCGFGEGSSVGPSVLSPCLGSAETSPLRKDPLLCTGYPGQG